MKKRIEAIGRALKPWAEFFRLPNLVTAPGDAIAGAAICLAVSLENPKPGAVGIALASGLAALFFYMFGLADNDIVGFEEDKTNAPSRPLPSNRISLANARAARGVCLLVAVFVGAVFRMPLDWWCVVILLVLAITSYNRVKDRSFVAGIVLIGLCRGLSVLAGATAMTDYVAPHIKLQESGSALESTSFLILPCWNSVPMWLAVAGWTLYTIGLTTVAVKEHEAEKPVGWWRFIPGLAIFMPMLALAEYTGSGEKILIVFCTTFAYAVWSLSMAPLGHTHDPSRRRKAIGNAVGALAYLQAAYILAYRNPALIAYVLILFVLISVIKNIAPDISGS